MTSLRNSDKPPDSSSSGTHRVTPKPLLRPPKLVARDLYKREALRQFKYGVERLEKRGLSRRGISSGIGMNHTNFLHMLDGSPKYPVQAWHLMALSDFMDLVEGADINAPRAVRKAG